LCSARELLDSERGPNFSSDPRWADDVTNRHIL